MLAAADVALPNAQALSAVGGGLLRNTITGGRAVLSAAVEGTDYYKPGGIGVRVSDGGTGTGTAPANGAVLIGQGGVYAPARISGTANRVIVTDGPGTINLSGPQDIAATSVPTFGGLVTTGGIRVAVATTTSSILLDARHHVVLCSGGVNVTLPTIGAADIGRSYIIKHVGATLAVRVAPAPGSTIDGNASATLQPERSRAGGS